MKVRVLIADDEAPARAKLRAHLAAEPDAEVVGEASDGTEAVEVLRRIEVDVVFLDVQMPGLDGFEVIDAIGLARMPPVVFVTAFEQFAVEAFEVQAIDYLLKPYDETRFHRAYARAVHQLSDLEPGRAAIDRLLHAPSPAQRHQQRFLVRHAGAMSFVAAAEVTRLSAAENYVELWTRDGTSHLIREKLSSVEARLDPEVFVRIHRSEIVNLQYVRELRPLAHGDQVVVLISGEQVRMSRRFLARFFEVVGQRQRP